MSSDWKSAALVAGVSAAVLGGLYLGFRVSRGRRHTDSEKDFNKRGPLADYMRSHNTENATLSQLRELSVAHRDGGMTTGVESGKLLTFLCRSIQAKKVLDIGVFTGCSSFAMALALPQDGKVIACDVSEDYANLGRPYWEQGGVSAKINLRIQPATKTLQELIDSGEEETFDLIFIDADKHNYATYFELGMKLLRTGGIFVVDNALWGGLVADNSVTDKNTVGIRKINDIMRDDPRVDFLLLNVSDGTGLAQKL